jgi:hypothetical protein
MAMSKEPGSALWRVRVCLPGSIIHLTSLTEPVVHMRDGRIASADMELVTTAPESGDTIGFIDWPVVVGLTWRAIQQPARDEQSNVAAARRRSPTKRSKPKWGLMGGNAK